MMLNINKGNENFLEYFNDDTFIDKSDLITRCNEAIDTTDRFICITRPRGFGKTLAISMLNAYYSKGCDSKGIFDQLKISKDPNYLKHLNKHNVIYINAKEIYDKSRSKGKSFVDEFKQTIMKELKNLYKDIDFKGFDVGEYFMLIEEVKRDRFIFLIDDWDAVFAEEKDSSECHDYIMLLAHLFNTCHVSQCFDLVYMTGVRPIRKRGIGINVDNFDECTMVHFYGTKEYFGFTEDETKGICLKHGFDFDVIKYWYGGYDDEITMYNPLSVCEAIKNKKVGQYWADEHSIETLSQYLNYGDGALKENVFKLLSGENIRVCVGVFNGNDFAKIDSTNVVLTILIHFGYLAYDPETETCHIPNREILNVFEAAVAKLCWR